MEATLLKKIKELPPCLRPVKNTSKAGMMANAREILDFIKLWKSLKKVSTRTDASPPKMNPNQMMNPGVLRSQMAQCMRLQQDNKNIVMSLNDILRGKGAVDCHQHAPPANGNYPTRVAEQDNIKQLNKELYDLLVTTESNYPYQEILQSWKKNLRSMQHMASYPFIINLKDEVDEVFRDGRPCRPAKTPAPCVTLKEKHQWCYFDMKVEGGASLGRIVFEVYSDVVPRTAANFVALCRGYRGLGYEGSPFHCINPGLYCQGGDFTKGNGSGAMSVYGETFPDENYVLKHGAVGVLSMANRGRNRNTSQFIITLRPLNVLDGKNVVIGKVAQGLRALLMVEGYGTRSGKPRRKVFIEKCGLLSSAK